MHEAQARIKIAGRNINNFRQADDTTLKAESEEELKNLLMKVKEESEKAGLKLNIQTKIMASSLTRDGGQAFFTGSLDPGPPGKPCNRLLIMYSLSNFQIHNVIF